jgi:threonylcarbamoyladenosine tRNA methylthiotransferase MtaB
MFAHFQRPTVALYTLGCKVNQAETDALADSFQQSGFRRVPFDDPADVYVVNTCTVTHVGDAKSRQILRQARRLNPKALVVATGCYASIVRDRMPVENVLVVRNRDKGRLVAIVEQHISPEVRECSSDKPTELGLGGTPSSRTRAMVKVQDGCDSACSYCIIPRARGRSVSISPETVIDRVRRLVYQGHKEIVITGVDLGSYGDNDPALPDLGGLLGRLLTETEVHRLRVSSVEPGDFNLEWLKLWVNPRLCRHLHVPLQAGSDGVLRRMRRRYDTAAFLEMIRACRLAVPGMAITTDVITGFPGETDAEFDEGVACIDRCRFDGMHVFPYSRRPGTGAAHLPDHVPEPVKKERGAILRHRAEEARRAHVTRHVGDTQEVVWESERNGLWRGTTGNNIRVFSADQMLTANGVDRRLLSALYADGCWGEPVDQTMYADKSPNEMPLFPGAPYRW